ncbi:MAG TPA: hypothetical protein VFQ35_12715 [Polyangiaceae bacterium]|nr:hypothetical protein [Polyangiaceae bacterium]
MARGGVGVTTGVLLGADPSDDARGDEGRAEELRAIGAHDAAGLAEGAGGGVDAFGADVPASASVGAATTGTKAAAIGAATTGSTAAAIGAATTGSTAAAIGAVTTGSMAAGSAEVGAEAVVAEAVVAGADGANEGRVDDDGAEPVGVESSFGTGAEAGAEFV